ncbi:hypothetical protein CDAR_442931 [Caerostris darwini]|uniref:Uncharacterized protein n=1 Tax=Caerostris darwini TaxID=1538125 RepID=A0AAV4VMJ1_9ARAC|nr:hypothetical protein CDAR_442931 [Caerostris darwini]
MNEVSEEESSHMGVLSRERERDVAAMGKGGGGVSAAREGARREVKRIASPDRREGDYCSPPSAAFDPSGRCVS